MNRKWTFCSCTVILNKFLGKSSLIRVNTLSNTNLITSIRQIEREKSTLAVDVTFLSKTSLDVGKDGPKKSWYQLMSYTDISERQSCI